MSLLRRAKLALSGKQAHVDPHCWRLPSSYSTTTKGRNPTVIPDPSIFANAHVPNHTVTGDEEALHLYPDTGHAALHLALLECFHKLRLSARELAWTLLLRVAVDRFMAWWSSVDLVLQHASAYSHRAGPEAAVQLTKEYLPPLDVLLVWYAFMLNVDAYLAACRARERQVPGLQSLSFPWLAIRDAIDFDTMSFHLPRGAQTLFSTLSGQRADILTYLESPPAYSDKRPMPYSGYGRLPYKAH
ncbi:hypothetical protein HRG_002993 [Hirsutella rhossiliensis]|uniref:Uncharacterized protein n=1 Tax=Hirsutella rhossiliensis TaxID=111463 RepID=A0A9P8N5F1_9HYPO|nr:uncharacterized protein HRG_02993 [Hirsutella rhossiliensis]KAH0964977.1 hypothetical protein HRG_02993 [Hirsutella rhossiliensis]